MRSHTLQRWIGLSCVCGTLGGLSYVSYRQLSQRGMQAEARLMLSYMQTLQSVYHIEHGQFAKFDQAYGASIQGKDNCEQPVGAAELGFLIHGCHDLKAPAPRYAYRSMLLGGTVQSYRLEAEAGSDERGRSFVCFSPRDRESWTLEQNQEIVSVESCW